MKKCYFLLIALGCLFVAGTAVAQPYDLLIKGGHVIDPKNQINGVMDVAIQNGKIAAVSQSIDATQSKRVVNAEGLYVTPGLIDLHGHHFWGTVPDRYLSNSFTALPPDGFTFRAGVTTAADAGGAGWRNFNLFKEQVIDRSQTRVLAFINILGDGMRGVMPYEQDTTDMNARLTIIAAKQHPEIIGVKIAHYRGVEWGPYQKAAEVGRAANIPVMVDLGGAGDSDSPLPLETLFTKVLRPGDILTHMYGGDHSGHGAKEGVLDKTGRVKPYWVAAQKNGLIFDVGHGGGSFFYEVAAPATQQGFWPNTISTDLHTGSMNAGMKDMLNVVSKMLDLGMPLEAVIEASTWKPAQVIHREELGNLDVGGEADVAVFSLQKGKFGYLDSSLNKKESDVKLQAELTIRAGRVVWDLNGIASKSWEAR